MGGSSKQTIGQRYFAKLTTFIGNPIEKLIGINFDNRGWIFKPDNDESFLRVESPNLYGDKEGGVAGFIDIHTGTADQLPNTTYSADFPKVSGFPFQSYLLFRGLGKKPATSGGIGQFTQGSSKHYNGSFYHGNSGYMKEMLLWPQRIHVRNDGRPQWYDEKAEINRFSSGEENTKKIYWAVDFSDGLTDFEFDRAKQAVLSALEELKMLVNIGCEISLFVYLLGCRSDFSGMEFSYANLKISNLDELRIYVESAQRVNQLQTTTVLNYASLFFNTLATENIIVICVANAFNGNAQHADGYAHQNQELLRKVTSKTIGFGHSPELIGVLDNTNTSPFLISNDAISTAMYMGITQKTPWIISFADLNPIHKIREILTDDTAMNKPESDVNEMNFKKAADMIFDESLGISWAVTEKSCLEAINELCGHIEAGIRMNRQSGLYEIVLFRDNWFSVDEIHTLPVSKIKSMQLDGAVSADELINKLNVSYYNREAIKNSSFSIAENAAIRNLNGYENAEEVKFPYFMNQRNAAVVSQWKLKQMSTPVWQGTFTTGFYDARKWNRYDLLKLAWPRKWSGTILVRIMKINLGSTSEVSIDFVEVVPYSSELSSSIGIDTPPNTAPKPPQPALFKAFELSYLEAVQLNGQKAVDDALAYNPDAGYAAVIAKRPQTNSLNALMYTDIGNGYEQTGAIQYCETAELDQNISQINTAFIVKDVGDIDLVATGTQITVNNEIMVYQSYDEETSLLTVKRGALDTIPQTHGIGSLLYFADDYVTVDPTEYVMGEIIEVKALTTTPSGVLGFGEVNAQQILMNARAIRPYPPANVKINNQYYPETHTISNDLLISWVDRNRLQQTGGSIMGFFEAGVTRESGVTYAIEISTQNDGIVYEVVGLSELSHTIPQSVLIPFVAHKIKMWSERDDYESYQVFEHSIFIESISLILEAAVQSTLVTGHTVPEANMTVHVDTSLSAKMEFDGSKIIGKAPAGSIITIEVEE